MNTGILGEISAKITTLLPLIEPRPNTSCLDACVQTFGEAQEVQAKHELPRKYLIYGQNVTTAIAAQAVPDAIDLPLVFHPAATLAGS